MLTQALRLRVVHQLQLSFQRSLMSAQVGDGGDMAINDFPRLSQLIVCSLELLFLRQLLLCGPPQFLRSLRQLPLCFGVLILELLVSLFRVCEAFCVSLLTRHDFLFQQAILFGS